MGGPVEAFSALWNGQIRPGWVCLSECCHGDDGLLRGMEHTLIFVFSVLKVETQKKIVTKTFYFVLGFLIVLHHVLNIR